MRLFYWSVGGLVGLGALIWAIAAINPKYHRQLSWYAVATSESSWQQYCGETRLILVGAGGYALWYDEEIKSNQACEDAQAKLSQPAQSLQAECPLNEGYTATNCNPETPILKAMWQVSQGEGWNWQEDEELVKELEAIRNEYRPWWVFWE